MLVALADRHDAHKGNAGDGCGNGKGRVNTVAGRGNGGLDLLLRGRLGLGTYLFRIIIPEVFYTVFLSLIVYRVFRYINYRFMSIARKESESIWVLK